MIAIKVFNGSTNKNFIYLNKSRIDGYPIYSFESLTFDKKKLHEFLRDNSKLIVHLRILKIKQIRKIITEKELIDFSILQYIDDNFNGITIVEPLEDNGYMGR
jgi:hypothetical protein